MRVYLAGPIEGCTDEERLSWREKASYALTEKHIESYSPKEDCIKSRADEHMIFYKDIYQVDRADVILVNIQAKNIKSFGTPFEMGYAYAKGKLIVMVCNEDQLYHPFVTIPSVYFTDLGEALDFIINENE